MLLDLKLCCSLDVLPDVVGYSLLFLGLGLLQAVHTRFREAWVCAGVLIFFSLADLLGVRLDAPRGPAATLTVAPFSVERLVAALLELILIWHLCSGIRDLARSCGLPRLAATAVIRRNLYVVVAAAGWLLVLFAADLQEFAAPLVLALLALALVMCFLLVSLMIRAGRELAAEIEVPRPTTATRVVTGLVFAAAACALVGVVLVARPWGLGAGLLPVGRNVVGTNLESSTDDLSGGRLRHFRLSNTPTGGDNFFVLELAPVGLPVQQLGSHGGSSSGRARADTYQAYDWQVPLDVPPRRTGIEYHYALPDDRLTIRALPGGHEARPAFAPGTAPAEPATRFDLTKGNLFVVRLGDRGDVEAVDQLDVYHPPEAGPALAVFKRILADDPDVQALRPQER